MILAVVCKAALSAVTVTSSRYLLMVSNWEHGSVIGGSILSSTESNDEDMNSRIWLKVMTRMRVKNFD